MKRKPTPTEIFGIVAMLFIIALLILSVEDKDYKEDIVYNTYVVDQDTIKLNVYGEVIR